MDYYAERLGVPGEIVRFATVLFLGFPLSVIYNLLPKQNYFLKHIYSIATTAIATWLVFSLESFIKYLVTCTTVYFACYRFKSSPMMPRICFAIAMCHLLAMHWQNQVLAINNPADTSSMMMILLIKLSSFSYCCYDGSQDEKVIILLKVEFGYLSKSALY
jgi:hypothetical protein